MYGCSSNKSHVHDLHKTHALCHIPVHGQEIEQINIYCSFVPKNTAHERSATQAMNCCDWSLDTLRKKVQRSYDENYPVSFVCLGGNSS